MTMKSGPVHEHQALRLHLLTESISADNSSPASDETSEPKEGTFSRGACFLLFGVSHWLQEINEINQRMCALIHILDVTKAVS